MALDRVRPKMRSSAPWTPLSDGPLPSKYESAGVRPSTTASASISSADAGCVVLSMISVPQSAWMTRTLLYWDLVGTIVPSDFIAGVEELDPYTLELVRAELVRQVFPSDSASMANFAGWLQQIPHRDLRRRQQAAENGETTRIWRDKFDENVEGLEAADELGLINPTWESWVEVERKTADEFMAALAMALCHPLGALASDTPGMPWVPVTDRRSAIKGLMRGLAMIEPAAGGDQLRLRLKGEIRASEIRTAILERALPVPSTPLDIQSLARFKKRRGDFLPTMRRHLESQVDEISATTDEAVRFRKAERLGEEIQELTIQVSAYLREAGARRIRKSSLLRLIACLPGGTVAARTQDFFGSLESARSVESAPLAYLAFARTELQLGTRYGRADPSRPSLFELNAEIDAPREGSRYSRPDD
jgi:hypothetical protein